MAVLRKYYFRRFPDTKLDIESQHHADNNVITRWRGLGTHHEEFAGIPATNKKIELHVGVQILAADASARPSRLLTRHPAGRTPLL